MYLSIASTESRLASIAIAPLSLTHLRDRSSIATPTSPSLHP
ncbi:hypothetical protein [Baaleninema simplex]|nr:hypothetical protein [Baaleninema simplex]